ncbi:MAG: cation-translocating P-type ATPase [Ardenticatenaceae bacterium]|nr:cation-translocating P-type ATPase [Ardenticatenaceae bacterium]
MTEHTFHITGMDCADCARSIEKGVARLDGIELCLLNFTSETLRVSGDVEPTAVINRVRELGYDVADSADPSTGPLDGQPPSTFFAYMWWRRDTRLALLATLLILPGLLFEELLPGLGVRSILIDAAAVAAMAIAGWPIFKSAWTAVRLNHEININVLMSIAAVGAVLIGAYTEAGMVMVLFVVAEAIEGYTTARARQSIRSLMELAPNQATVLRECIDCAGHLGQDGYVGGPCPFCGLEEQRVSVDELRLGETIIVKPGERVPMDGRLLSGSSAVNQAPITGESVPVDKQPGDEVCRQHQRPGHAGIKGHAPRRRYHHQPPHQMVEEARKQAPTQRFVDRFARYYTRPSVIAAWCHWEAPRLAQPDPVDPLQAVYRDCCQNVRARWSSARR